MRVILNHFIEDILYSLNRIKKVRKSENSKVGKVCFQYVSLNLVPESDEDSESVTRKPNR